VVLKEGVGASSRITRDIFGQYWPVSGPNFELGHPAYAIRHLIFILCVPSSVQCVYFRGWDDVKIFKSPTQCIIFEILEFFSSTSAIL